MDLPESMTDERVAELHWKLLKSMDEHLTTDEAREVWHELHRMSKEDPRLKMMLYLQERLDKELARGKRCGVCGRYDDEQCWTEC